MKSEFDKDAETPSSDSWHSWAPIAMILVPIIGIVILGYLAHEAGFDRPIGGPPISTMCERGC